MNETLQYYNSKATAYTEDTQEAKVNDLQMAFLKRLPKGGRILDFGCGSGRDTKLFMNQGFAVDATDGSEELCKIASAYTGVDVKCMLFQELDEMEKYDGIWACSSILHLPKTELLDVFHRMCRALKEDGIIYTSFKYGEFEGMRNGRYFTDFTEESFGEFIAGIPDISVVGFWMTNDVRPGRGDERWLNMILKRTGSR